MRRLMQITLLAWLCTFGANVILAQRVTGTLRGQILDPAGSSVANAQVTAMNEDTGVSVTMTTTSAGTYNFPSVLPGKYTVTVETSGFKKLVRSGVLVQADQDNVADAKLDLGTATETVEVSASTVEVQTASSTVSNDYDSSQVANLPAVGGTQNGSPFNLAMLAPNVIAQPGGTVGVGGSVGGTRPRENNFVVDGVDDNNLGVSGPNSTVIPDAVGEFVLLTNQFSAEYGHSSGGQFILVTKTGTNNWHGSGEWYAQNRNLNAMDNLTKAAISSGTITTQPPFDNNRFGGTFGGPIVKDKFFFFGAYEYTTLHGQGSATPLLAPTASSLATLKSMAADSAVSNILNNFPVAGQADVPAKNWPVVNGTPIPIGNLTIFSPVFQREHDAQFNTDYTRGKHQIGTRFTFNQEKFIFPVNSTQAVFNQDQLVRNRKIALTDVWTLSSHVVNDFRLQYSYFGEFFANPCTVCPNDVTIGDLGSNTIGPGDNSTQKQNTYQIRDNVSWSRGKHTFTFGGEYTHFIYPQFFLPRSNGDYWYGTTQVFIRDLKPDNVGRTLRGAGTGSFLGTQSLFAVFAQDDFKLNPRLTLNLGLRYEYWTNPVGDDAQALNAISSVPGVITFGKPKTDKNNFGPRVGLAWDPRGSELNEPSACTLTPQPSWCASGTGFLAGGGLPQAYIAPATQLQARRLTTSFIDDTVMPKYMNWTLAVEHQLYRNATLEVRYLGTHGLSLPVQFRRNHISAFDAGIAPLPTFFKPSDVPAAWTASTPTDAPLNAFNSNIYAPYGFRGNVTADPPFGSSTYHGGSLNFKQRARYGITLNANYTYSHAQDNSTNEFFTSLLNPRRAQDTTRLREDWSSSDLDVRHHFALTMLYEVPRTHADSRLLKAALNGYEVNTVYISQTGQPITLQSGNAGIDSNGNGDTAGDRASLNPFGAGLVGSDVYAVCELPGGATGLSNGGAGAFGTPTGVAAGGGCFDPSDPKGIKTFPAIGYTPVNTGAKFIVTGPGARANVGRNSWTTPGFGILNLAVGKRTYFGESRFLEVRADVFNILNHKNYTLSNGNVFNASGVTVATTTPGYALPTDPNFLNAPALFSGGNRTITLVLKLTF